MNIANAKVRYDDGLSRLSADDYVQIRMLPFLAQIVVKTPYLSFHVSAISIFSAIFAVVASALSTYGYSVFIPATLAISSSLASWGAYNQLEQRLFKKNIAIQHIRRVR